MTIFASPPPSLVDRIGKQIWRVRDEANGPATAVLHVVRLDRTSWRISVASMDQDGPTRLLGYVERLERDRYELLWTDAPLRWAYVTAFDLALTAMSNLEKFDGSVSLHRDPTVEPPAPTMFHRIRRRSKNPQAA